MSGLRRMFSIGLAMCALAVVCSGCTASSDGSRVQQDQSEVQRDEPHVQRAGGSVMMVAPAEPEFVMDARVSGTLTRDAEGCLALDTGVDVPILQFPFGSTLMDDGAGIDVPGLGTVRIGDSIDGGGGLLSEGMEPDECRSRGGVVAWQTVAG